MNWRKLLEGVGERIARFVWSNPVLRYALWPQILYFSKGSPPPAPDYMGAAQAQGAANVETARASSRLSNPNITTPLGYRRVSFGNDDSANIVESLTPQGQQRFDQEQRIIGQLGGMAEGGLGRIQGAIANPFSFGGPGPVSSLSQGNFSGGPQAITNQRGPLRDDFSADRQRVEDAIYSRMEPNLARDREALRTQLINTGHREGSEGYNTAMQRADQQTNDARMQAVLAGGQEQSRLFGMDLEQGQYGLQGEQQAFGQRQASSQMGNQAEQARLAQQQAAGGFQNQARMQQLQEALSLRQMPLNEVNALRSGSQVQLPQFQAFQGQQIAPPPIFGATQAAGDYAADSYNAQQQSQASMMGGLMGLGGSLGAASILRGGMAAGGASAMPWLLSDRRLKSNIVRVGDHPLGIGIYEFDLNGQRRRGVMADEVLEVKPDAVREGADGYFQVNYGAL